MSEQIYLIISVVIAIGGFALSYLSGKKQVANKLAEVDRKAADLLKQSEKDAENLKKEKLLEVKEEWHKKKMEFERESQKRDEKLNKRDDNIQKREDGVEQKLQVIQKKEINLQGFEEDLKKREAKLEEKFKEAEKFVEQQNAKLEKIAGLTRDEAKKQLIENFLNEAKTEAVATLNQIREEAKITAQREAQSIIVQAIQRTASDHSVETTVSVVSLDSDEMKGRIIGREGRNIRAFEAATGIDLIIDDTPEAVVISGFDPFRREVAKKALEKLMLDGRIHPSRIEEVVNKTQKELEEEIYRIGENALIELGVHGMRQGLVKYIGKMKYRSSYGQNLLSHSIEVAYLCGIMAAELGLDPAQAKRAGLLHDIGKCVDKDTDGPHALIGMELCKKNKENRIVCNAVGAHHEDIEMESPYAVLVQAADSISGARPGARRESLENYIKRLEKLESLANEFEGVQKTFAIQAGREIRVIVEPEKVTDQIADDMANEIAKRIEHEMEYPGQIKVAVIRERRSIALAK